MIPDEHPAQVAADNEDARPQRGGARAGSGRKPTPKHLRRTARLTLRFTDAEKAEILARYGTAQALRDSLLP